MFRLTSFQHLEKEDSSFLGPSLRFDAKADGPLTYNAKALEYLKNDLGPELTAYLELDKSVVAFDPSAEFVEADWSLDDTVAGILLKSTFTVLKGCRWPVFELGSFRAGSEYGEDDGLLGTYEIPTRYTNPFMPANLAMFLAQKGLLASTQAWDQDAFQAMLFNMLPSIHATGMGGINQRPVLARLHELGVPLTEISRTVYRAGEGASARFIRGSLTSRTDWCAARIVTNKFATSHLLAGEGIPVTECHVSPSPEQTKKLAAKMGYPVVLKANKGNFGRGQKTEIGVFANIANEEALDLVLEQADFEAEQYIIEKHFYGESFRVVVFDGKPVLVQKNGRPFVKGDGTSSIRELIAEASTQSLVTDVYFQKTFNLENALSNEAVLRTLKQQGLTLDTILGEDEQAILLQAGMVTDVGGVLEFHPPSYMSETIREAVTKVLRIVQMTEASVDFVGEDLCLPDPQFIICEVNAAPAFLNPTEQHYLMQVAQIMAESVKAA